MQRRIPTRKSKSFRTLDDRGKVRRLHLEVTDQRQHGSQGPYVGPTTEPTGEAASIPDQVVHDHVSTVHMVNETVPRALPGQKYQDKQKKLSAAWDDLRPGLSQQLIADQYPATFQCALCPLPEPLVEPFRCNDCGPSAYFCHDCCEKLHRVTKGHTPQLWSAQDHCFNEYNFVHAWARPDGHHCEHTHSSCIIVIDHKGIQRQEFIKVCKCEPEARTLVRNRLWPATPQSPNVAFTFECMLLLRALILEGQLSLRAFCSVLQSNKTCIDYYGVKDIYRILCWEVVINFMHLYHTHENLTTIVPGFSDGTSCLACPQATDTHKRIVAIDACFSLIQRKSTGQSIRPPLHGSKYFLDQTSVDNFVSEQDDTIGPEEQTCSDFKATSIIRTKTKNAKLNYTGVMASVCSHDIPDKALNLRHGERLAYAVFILGHTHNAAIVMYDIACKLMSHLKVKKIPLSPETKFAVPIFHAYGHKYECQVEYSPRRVEGCGLADGEGVERLWSYLGKFRLVTREQKFENRADLLTEALLWYAYRLNGKIGVTLSRRLEKAYMVKESTANGLEEVLSLLPDFVCLDDITKWAQYERGQLSKSRHKKTGRDWQNEYALLLNKYYGTCDDVASADEDSEDGTSDLPVEKARCETLLGKIEARHHITRWDRNSATLKRVLSSACHEQRMFRLQHLRDHVVQYTYMVSLKKKYARGQSLSNRITEQLKATNKKLLKALAEYNLIPPHGPVSPPHNLTRDECIEPGAQMWQCLSPSLDGSPYKCIPAVLSRKAIDAYHLNRRADEEIVMVKQGMSLLCRNINQQICVLSEKKALLENCPEESLDQFQLGCLSAINAKLKLTQLTHICVQSIYDKAHETSTIQDYHGHVEQLVEGYCDSSSEEEDE